MSGKMRNQAKAMVHIQRALQFGTELSGLPQHAKAQELLLPFKHRYINGCRYINNSTNCVYDIYGGIKNERA